MAEVDSATAEEEHQYHYYTGRRIPWFVHLIWVLFWCFAAYYIIRFLLPSLQTELLAPP
jgi:hypothetical protein